MGFNGLFLRLRRVASVMVLALLVAACSAAAGSEVGPIRLGVNLWVGYDLLEVAEQQNLFAEHGVDIEIVDFTSLSDVVAAFERGHIDGMATTISEVLQVRSASVREPEIVLVTDYSNGADVIVAESSIRGAAGLAGQTVVAEAPLGPFILSQALGTVGLSLDDVDLVFADQLEMPAIIASGDAVAAVTFPPVSVELISDHDFRKIFTTAGIPNHVVDVVSFDAGVLAAHPDLASAVRGAWDEAVALLGTAPGPTIEALAAREGISVDEMTVLLTEVEMVTWRDQSVDFGDGTVERICTQTAEVLVDLSLLDDATVAEGCAAEGES
jgi:NitT/TauT family transport system substrate-binding protein